MKNIVLALIIMILPILSNGQDVENDLKMISEFSSKNPEIRDILQMEGIEYLKLKFIGKELGNKSFKLSVKEIWNGKIIKESTVMNSRNIAYEEYQIVNDTILTLKVISKLTDKNKLRMNFQIPNFSISKEYDAIVNHDYSLRNIAAESKLKISYSKKFNLLAYILPYTKPDGSKSWCDVGTDGNEVEKWEEKFGIKHYLFFEMKFE